MIRKKTKAPEHGGVTARRGTTAASELPRSRPLGNPATSKRPACPLQCRRLAVRPRRKRAPVAVRHSPLVFNHCPLKSQTQHPDLGSGYFGHPPTRERRLLSPQAVRNTPRPPWSPSNPEESPSKKFSVLMYTLRDPYRTHNIAYETHKRLRGICQVEIMEWVRAL